MEQKTEASQAVDDQAISVEVYNNAVWLTKGMQVFRLAYTGESDADRNWYAGQLRAALKAQPAPTEAAQGDAVIPASGSHVTISDAKFAIKQMQSFVNKDNAFCLLLDDNLDTLRKFVHGRAESTIADRAAQGEDSVRLVAMLVDRDTPPDNRRDVIDHDIRGNPITREMVARASAETGGVKP